ncbi:universal stress protein [Polyangium spumosum]|nr:universal stress protein [Polyangium spumosum]
MLRCNQTAGLRATSSTRTPRMPRLAAQANASRGRILFAACASGAPTQALRRAVALATALDADLFLLRVTPHASPEARRRFSNELFGAVVLVDRTLTTLRQTRAWCDAVLPEPLPSGHIQVRSGDFIEEVVSEARALGAALIVLPPDEGHSGSRVTAISTRANVPVLVARPSTGVETILAATDLQDHELPVLRRAASFARRLGTEVVLVHNVPPTPVVPAWKSFFAHDRSALFSRLARLRKAATSVDVDSTDAVVKRDASAVDAILAAAREKDVDIVVVGTRARRPGISTHVSSVASRIVERARRSVLVTPVRARPPYAALPS